MERPCICAIGNSATIRETISIILGADYRVRCYSGQDCLRDPNQLHDADLLVVADGALSRDAAASLKPGVPILWVYTDGALPGMPASESFEPERLCARVKTLLASPPAIPATAPPSMLGYPVLTHEASVLAKRAATTSFPVLICGEAGTGKARLGRAIHVFGNEGRFIALPAASCTWAALHQAGLIAPGPLTALVHDVEQVSTDGQQLLLELLDCGGFESAVGWHPVRLICATAQSLETLARVDALDKELLYRMSVYPIALPALRQRREDIPALVSHIASGLVQSLHSEAVEFTARAMHRLVNYWWFGNLAELETVLTRTIALSPRRMIDAEDLLFGFGRVVPRVLLAEPANASEAIREPAGNEAVDLIINELAHEFKNPMVTIKTIAQHLERLLADETGREQVARLTGEAVDRMDRALENLLQFTRFRTPSPERVSLNALLAPTLTDLTPALTERRVVLNYRPPDASPVFVDAAQIGYAFENLLRVMMRDLPEGETLSIRPVGAAGVAFEFTGIRAAYSSRLPEFLDHPPSGPDSQLPLGLVFAKTLIERNGGQIEIRTTTQGLLISVSLPSREEIVPGNGKTTSLSH